VCDVYVIVMLVRSDWCMVCFVSPCCLLLLFAHVASAVALLLLLLVLLLLLLVLTIVTCSSRSVSCVHVFPLLSINCSKVCMPALALLVYSCKHACHCL